MPLKDWQLPVLMDGHPICQISGGGNVRYRPEDVAAGLWIRPYKKPRTHQKQFRSIWASWKLPLFSKHKGLDERYKQLADFNGVVLAGHSTRYGVQFVTWDWDYGRTDCIQRTLYV